MTDKELVNKSFSCNVRPEVEGVWLNSTGSVPKILKGAPNVGCWYLGALMLFLAMGGLETLLEAEFLLSIHVFLQMDLKFSFFFLTEMCNTI